MPLFKPKSIRIRRTRRPVRNARRPRTMRRTLVRRAPASFKRGEYHFKRWAQQTSGNFTINGNAAFAPYQAANVFTLADLPNVSDFTNLFDHYRINKVVMRFWLRIDPGAQAAATASYPKHYSVIDYDDTTLLTQAEMRQHANCRIRVMYPNRPVTIVFTPATLGLTYLSAVGSTFSPQWKKWVDMANTAVPHYGLKWNVDDLTNTNYKIDVETCFYISVKGVR